MSPENPRDEVFEAAQNKFMKAHGINPHASQEQAQVNHVAGGHIGIPGQFLGNGVENTRTPSPAEITRLIEEAKNNPEPSI